MPSSLTIDHLPVEILREIFIRCLSPLDPSNARNLSVLLLCHICSHWRGASLHYSNLWTSITLRYLVVHDMDDKNGSERYWSSVEDWLGRSGTGPLSVAFAESRQCLCIPSCTRAFSSNFQRVFRHHQHRISLLFAGPRELIELHLSPLEIDSFIISCRHPDDNYVNTLLNIWRTSPMLLRKINFTQICKLITPTRGVFLKTFVLFGLGRNLTHLITPLCFDPHLSSRRPWNTLLKYCPRLVCCVLLFTPETSFSTVDNLPAPITLSHLVCLTVVKARFWTIAEIFDGLHTPALKTLRFSGSLKASQNADAHCAHLIEQIGGLKRLSILETFPEDLSSIFSTLLLHLPQLEELDLEVCLRGQISRGQYVNGLANLLIDRPVSVINVMVYGQKMFHRISPFSIIFPFLLPPSYVQRGISRRDQSNACHFFAGTESNPCLPNLRLLSLEFGVNKIDSYIGDHSTLAALKQLVVARNWHIAPVSGSQSWPRGIHIYVPTASCRQSLPSDMAGLEVKVIPRSTERHKTAPAIRHHWMYRMTEEELQYFDGLGSKWFEA